VNDQEKGVSTVTPVLIDDTTSNGSHADAVQQRVLELQRWREQIPRFSIPAASDATRRLVSAASVPAPFIELTNVAVMNQPALERTEGVKPAQVRDLMRYADAYGPLADELETLAQFIRYSVTAARYAVGHEALTTYALAQRAAKLPQNAHLKPLVADLRRALGRGRKLTPEAAAQKAAERAAKAAEKLAAKAAKLQAATSAITKPQQSS
jgi:hypothetical protein